MKAIYTLIAVAASPAALAHTGDHSTVASAIAHAFGSADHLGAALIVMAGIAGVIALTGKFKQARKELAARHAE